MPLSPHGTLTASPEILSSLPPSPTLLDEDLSLPRAWREDQGEFEMQHSRRSPGSGSSTGKGKDKQSFDEDDEDEDTVENHVGSSHEAYPPTTDAAAETRRVEQRERLHNLAHGPSLLADVTRKASLILSRRKPSLRASEGAGLGNHRALKSRESLDVTREGYAVPLDEVDQNDRAIAVHSPSPFAFEQGIHENPFMHPSESLEYSTPIPRPSLSPSPHSGQPAVITESVILPKTVSPENGFRSDDKTRGRAQPSVLASTAPQPRPLGLPPPVTSRPLPDDAPHKSPLKPTPPPVLSRFPIRGARREERSTVVA
ncbi:hypothetical protein BU15DRAFT_71276 [Melanogaster broomeanus]|nr:hypothetical protein BU15DRAFT_71276 [Melanogaster broomeanus]